MEFQENDLCRGSLAHLELISRQPRFARSIQLLVDPEAQPILCSPRIQPDKPPVQRY